MEGTGGEIDTFNLTPKSPRSKIGSPNNEKSPPMINIVGTTSKQLFQAFKQSEQRAIDTDSMLKIEELETKVFQLTSENAALTKGIDKLEDMLAKSKEDMDQAIQDLNDAHMEEINTL